MPKEINTWSVLLKPVVTEKTTFLTGQNKFVFEVDLRANKMQIKEAVEKAFDVTVVHVNTMVVRGKVKRFGRGFGQQPDRKKAVVTLAPGDSIELFEGV